MSVKINNALPTTIVPVTSGIDGDVNNSFTLDRYLGDTLSLPYTYNEIKIKTKELCVADNINASLHKLHYNFLYLNAQTRVASNQFPTIYDGFLASTKTTGSSSISWYNSSTVTNHLSTQLSAYGDGTTSNGTILSGLVDCAVVHGVGHARRYVGFAANSAALMAFHASEPTDNSADILFVKKTIEDATSIPFTNIKSVAINSDKHLFVLDDVLIHKFNVDNVLTSNPATSAIGRFLLKTIGGVGTSIFDKDKFNTPIALDIGKDDKVYILDQEHRGYKVYDRELNWISTASKRANFINELSGSPVVDISVDKVTEHVYVLSKGGAILEYDKDDFFVNTHILKDKIDSGEIYKKIVQSRKYDNVLYVLTDKALYKKFKTKMSRSIGAFKLVDNNIRNDRLTFVDVMISRDLTYDFVFLGSEVIFTNVGSDVGSIYKFNEDINYKTISREIYKSNLFPLSSIDVNNDEYVTSWVVNKSIHKILYNHMLFRDSIFGKYTGMYDGLGRQQYVGVDYLTEADDNLFDYSVGINNFIGLNEVVLAETINRPLKELYDLQVELLGMCKEKYSNIFPLVNQVAKL
jgi:hypothetical protein